MCHVSLAGLPTPGGRGAGATLGNAQSSDPHTPAGFGAWDYVAEFLGLFGGRLRSLCFAQCSPARCGRASAVAQLCRNVEQQVVPGQAVPAGEGSPHWPLVAVLGLLCPCPWISQPSPLWLGSASGTRLNSSA